MRLGLEPFPDAGPGVLLFSFPPTRTKAAGLILSPTIYDKQPWTELKLGLIISLNNLTIKFPGRSLHFGVCFGQGRGSSQGPARNIPGDTRLEVKRESALEKFKFSCNPAMLSKWSPKRSIKEGDFFLL